MALPVDTAWKYVEREVDLQLQGLMSCGRGWQPGKHGRKQKAAVYRRGETEMASIADERRTMAKGIKRPCLDPVKIFSRR